MTVRGVGYRMGAGTMAVMAGLGMRPRLLLAQSLVLVAGGADDLGGGAGGGTAAVSRTPAPSRCRPELQRTVPRRAGLSTCHGDLHCCGDRHRGADCIHRGRLPESGVCSARSQRSRARPPRCPRALRHKGGRTPTRWRIRRTSRRLQSDGSAVCKTSNRPANKCSATSRTRFARPSRSSRLIWKQSRTA